MQSLSTAGVGTLVLLPEGHAVQFVWKPSGA
jgi:hypothetical protein